jgi:exopolysaccharide biosynthesis WecB/TagA/CpsF family protein
MKRGINVADVLVDALLHTSRGKTPRGAAVTWINHYSVLQEGESSLVNRFDFVAVDGVFLCRLLGLSTALRSSADMVLPKLLAAGSFKSVALVGGAPGVASSKVDAVRALCRQPDEVYVSAWDGYAELEALLDNLDSWYHYAGRPEVIVLGLGAPLQNEVAVAMSGAFPDSLVLTCGGWLDQVGTNYYPEWAYPLRLNWLVRLAKEPRRLAPRYSVDAIRALLAHKRIRRLVHQLPGYSDYVGLSSQGNRSMPHAAELSTLSS